MARHVSKILAGTSAFALAVLVPAASASAQSGEAVITNTETVNVSLTPSGEPDVARVYDQIAVQGSGDVAYRNPVSTVNLRNLDRFGGFTVEDGSVVEETTVDGQFRQRSVSDFDKDLPVSLSVVYTLDGEPIEPGDLVGRTGAVEATYTITNETCADEEITVEGADGAEQVNEQVCDPLAGSLSFTLPSNYTDITSETGFVTAGDGRGGTLMTLSITLIPGLTEPTTTASYSAQVQDAVIPPASMSIIPVVVDANPSASAQRDALAGGIDTGKQIAGGAGEIDANLLRLADGAGDLVNGLILLRNGSAELSDGLVNTAVPGSQQLAAGSAELAAGLNDTAVPGSQQLAAGADELAAGLNGTAVPGSQQLADGARQVADGAAGLQAGLDQLAAGVNDLPETVKEQVLADPQYQRLTGTLQKIIVGIGKPTDTTKATLLGGLNLAKAGLRWPAGFANTDCQVALAGQDPQKCGAMDAVQFISGALSSGATNLNQLKPAFQGLNTALGAAACSAWPPTTPPAVPPATPCDLIKTIYFGLYGEAPFPPGAQAQVNTAAGALTKVYTQVDAELVPGLTTIQRVLYNSPCDPSQTNQQAPDFCGIAQALGIINAGLPELIDGITESIQANLQAAIGSAKPGCEPEVGKGGLRCGAAALTDGADQVADGAEELAGGLAAAGSGSQQLADGAGQLSEGLVTAGDGASQVADGNAQLAEGLETAADGSVQLSDGLETAAGSAPAIPEGANRLSEEGTQVLQQAGKDAALSFGTRVAVLEASAERTADGGLPFGAPEGALAAAAYRYDVAGADGQGAQTTGQLVAGVAIAGAAAAGAGVMARRRAA